MTNENQSKNQGESSLLDEVLKEQQIERKQQFRPQELLAELFNILNKQEIEILKRRHALHEAEEARKHTLEEIGKEYKVTRERIRQIENRAIIKIKNRNGLEETLGPIETIIFETLEEYGGIMEENFLVKQLLQESIGEQVFEQERQATIFIISKLLDEDLEKVIPDEHFMPGWKLKLANVDAFRKLVEELHTFIDELGKPTRIEGLIESFKKWSNFESEEISEKLIVSALELSSKTKKNPFDEWGMISWRTIVPRRMADKIYLVLGKAGKPLHFKEITEAINSRGFDHKTANPATVHNELIMDDKYILVGRGVYALKEWGYIPGVVSDVVTAIVRQRGPLSREEIISQVLKQRLVKPGTVVLALADKTRFKKLGDDRYAIVE